MNYINTKIFIILGSVSFFTFGLEEEVGCSPKFGLIPCDLTETTRKPLTPKEQVVNALRMPTPFSGDPADRPTTSQEHPYIALVAWTETFNAVPKRPKALEIEVNTPLQELHGQDDDDGSYIQIYGNVPNEGDQTTEKKKEEIKDAIQEGKAATKITTGSIITKQFVITSTDCQGQCSAVAMTGIDDVSSLGKPEMQNLTIQLRETSEIIFSSGNWTVTKKSDRMALLKLRQYLDFQKNVNPISIGGQELISKKNMRVCQMVGWDTIRRGPLLIERKLLIRHGIRCRSPKNICSFTRNPPCGTLTGAPIICGGRLLALVIHNETSEDGVCGRKASFSIFERVTVLTPLIKDNIPEIALMKPRYKPTKEVGHCGELAGGASTLTFLSSLVFIGYLISR